MKRLTAAMALAALAALAFQESAVALSYPDYGPVNATEVHGRQPGGVKPFKARVKVEIKGGDLYVNGDKIGRLADDGTLEQQSTYGSYTWEVPPGGDTITVTWNPKTGRGYEYRIELPTPLPQALAGTPPEPGEAGGPPATSRPSETGGGVPWFWTVGALVLLAILAFVWLQTRGGMVVGDHKQEATYQPDILLKFKSQSAFTGEGVYSADGKGQQISGKAKKGNDVEVQVIVQNDGTAEDTITFQGPASDSTRGVLYLDRTTGGTGMLSPTWRRASDAAAASVTETLQPGAQFAVHLRVRSDVDNRVEYVLTATSGKDPSKKDVATVAIDPRP